MLAVQQTRKRESSPLSFDYYALARASTISTAGSFAFNELKERAATSRDVRNIGFDAELVDRR